MGFDFCNETERQSLIALFSRKRDMDIKPLYTYICPVIIFVCFFSIIFNAILISISRQSKFTNKSPILLLSLNLAVTDLIASLLNGLGILFNSYLPEVFKFQMGQCSMLMFEVVRCAALIASALHLLALAFVHYRGIVSPLHYRSTIFFSQHLSRMINIISIFCWIIPLTIMIVWFSSTPCQGFQTAECDYLFLLGSAYRYMVLSVFLLPLVLMSIIYVRIFIIISRHQRGRRLEQERSTLTRGVISVTGPIGSAAAGVNLPELAKSQCNSPIPEDPAKCPVCAGRERNRLTREDDAANNQHDEDDDDDGDDDDDDGQTVSMLSEQTDSAASGQSSEPSPNAASCHRAAATIDKKTPASLAATSGRGDNDDADADGRHLTSDRQLAPAAIELKRRHRMADNDNKPPDASLCDNRKLDGTHSPDDWSRRGRSNNGSDAKALVLILEHRADQEAPTSAASVKLKRAANRESAIATSLASVGAQASVSGASAASSTEHSTIEAPEEVHKSAAQAPVIKQQGDTLRVKLSLGSELKSLAIGGSDTNGGRRERRLNRLKQQSNISNASDTQRNNAASSQTSNNLENLLLQKCTCDNKLSQQQQRARGGPLGKLARANTIGFDAQRTTTTTTVDQTKDRDSAERVACRQPAKALMSSISGTTTTTITSAGATNTTGSSISSGTATSSLRLQLRRTAPSDNNNNIIKSRLTATTSVTANNTTQCGASTTTTVTKSNSNSLASGGALQMSGTIDNVATAAAVAAASSGASRSQSVIAHHQEPTRRHVHASAVPQTNTKALITTLLILGTYFVSYAPAIIYQVLTCIDHCPYPLYEISYGRRVLFGAMTTVLLIAKSIVDPLIYSYRMNEIQLAIGRYLSKRRSKSSSHAASLHTSQRFTFGANTSQQNLSIKSHHAHLNHSHSHRHHHHHHNTIQSRRPHELSAADSSFKILNKSQAGLRTKSSVLTPHREDAADQTRTSAPASDLKLSRQATSPSGLGNGHDELQLISQTRSGNNALALKLLATRSNDKRSQCSSINGRQPQSDSILANSQQQTTTSQRATMCNGTGATIAAAALTSETNKSASAAPMDPARSGETILSPEIKPEANSISSSLIC